MVCSVAGITSDANVLTNELRVIAQRYQLNYGEPMPCEQLVSYLCDIKQAYTQYGGKRPFGVSILYMGWDKHYGYQLYQSDPSGNYGGWKATCIGNNSGVRRRIERFVIFYILMYIYVSRPLFQFSNKNWMIHPSNWAMPRIWPWKYWAKRWIWPNWHRRKVINKLSKCLNRKLINLSYFYFYCSWNGHIDTGKR